MLSYRVSSCHIKRSYLYLSISIGFIITVVYFSDKFPNKINSNIVNYNLFQIDKTHGQCVNIKARLRNISTPFSAIEVHACGSFRNRVKIFNEELHNLRSKSLKSRGCDCWKTLANRENITLIWTAKDEFLQQLGNFPQIRLVMLPWAKTEKAGKSWNSLEDNTNLLIQRYYEWTADERLCNWIEASGLTHQRYDIVHNKTCYRNMEIGNMSQSLRTVTLNAKLVSRNHYWPNDGKSYPPSFYTEPPPFSFYIFLITDGIVTRAGDVFSGAVKLVSYSCCHSTGTAPPYNISKIPLYDEIFVISHCLGNAVYHKMVEVIPRLSLYLDFLKRNPCIKILVWDIEPALKTLITALGIDTNRLITGMFRAKVVYLPRAVSCCYANVQESQAISLIYRSYIKMNFPNERRNKLVLIRRSRFRKFTEQNEIQKVVETAAKYYSLKFVLYKDNPPPALNDTMKIFNSAFMVVAPHGAGLSNLLFSEPGTYVVEGVCNLPWVNLCFQRLSYVLGHRWHGVSSHNGCQRFLNVSVVSLTEAIVTLLNQAILSPDQRQSL